MTDWDRAADHLEALLETAAGLIDGESEGEPEATTSFLFDLGEPPSIETLERVRDLLCQVDDAVSELSRARDAVGRELDHLGRHRTAASAYIAAPQR